MRMGWDHISRILAREPEDKSWFGLNSASWKYVHRNIRHARWFFCRNPITVLRDLVWWVRYRTTNRFHVLHIDSLKPGWCDTDYRLLHASFTLLEKYVENEKPFKVIEWNSHDGSRDNANEIHELYLWWKRHKELPDTFNMDEENNRYQQETDNLIRLMKIRMTLWT